MPTLRAIIVSGTRRLRKVAPIADALGSIDVKTLIIHGDAEGVDRLAADFFRDNGFSVVAMPAMWKRDGNTAGPIRNQAMLEVLLSLRDCGYDVAVHAFPCDESKGTWHMVNVAKKAGVPTFVHKVTVD